MEIGGDNNGMGNGEVKDNENNNRNEHSNVCDSNERGDETNDKSEANESDELNGVELSKNVNNNKDKDDDSDDDDDEDKLLKYDPTPFENPFPSPKWNSIKQLQQREYGNLMVPGSKRPLSQTFNSQCFRRYAYNSLFFFQRFELMGKFEEHHGCVNCLNFNNSGDLLCSGSDDLRIAVWDWQKTKIKCVYHSGHSSNVFQCKWCLDDHHIISCSRDGQVRICNLERTTIVSNKLAQHRGPAHKLTLTAPQVILSCGEDGVVNEIDLRADKPTKLLIVKNETNERRVPLYSIHSNMTFNPYQFVVSGRDPLSRIYDIRSLSNTNNGIVRPVQSLCPSHLTQSKHSVTCSQFNPTGNLVLSSYNDEEIYTFNAKTGAVDNVYRGHRNNATVKGCSWFGDNFIVSGSDDGYVYGWDHESQHIVMSLYADENGVVNCIEPHPTAPILATSGLDDNVKLWVPSADQWPQTLKGIKKRICTNVKDRKLEHKRFHNFYDEDAIDASMLYLFIRHIRRQRARAARMRQRTANNDSGEADDDDDDDEDNDDADDDDDDDLDGDDDSNEHSNQCVPS